MADLRYLTDGYLEPIRKVNQYGAPLNFVFITDEHNRYNCYKHRNDGKPFELAVNAVDSIQYVLDRCPGISFVVNGGDIGNDSNEDPQKIRDSYKEIMDAFYRLSVPVHCCIGNHDDALGMTMSRGETNTAKYIVTPAELYQLCMKNNPTDKTIIFWICPICRTESFFSIPAISPISRGKTDSTT